MSTQPVEDRKHTVVIIGAGAGGIAVAARLKRARASLDIAIVDAAQHHYYQAAWTLVGGGRYDAERTRRDTKALIPSGVALIAHQAAGLEPENNRVVLDDGTRVGYDFLVVAAGIELNWDAIEGLTETLGKNGVTSNYRYDLAPYTWDLVQAFNGGSAIFTQPSTPIKCPGAPQKALYLTADFLRKRGKSADLWFYTGAGAIFGVPFYAKALDQIVADYGAKPLFGFNLVAVDGPARTATFERTVDGQTTREEVKFDLLHVVPPQRAPALIRGSALADAAGWLEVDKHTLRHVRQENVFGLGDATSTPNSKTAAAVKNQAPVVAANLLRALDGQAPAASYDGYAGCPLTTSAGKVLLAEFTYGGTVATTLPLDPRAPRRFYGWVKKTLLPLIYWNFILKGRDWPGRHRQREFPQRLPVIRP